MLIQETQRRQYECHNTPLGYYTDQDPYGRGQYNSQGVYCGLSLCTTQLCACLCNYNGTFFSPFHKRVVLQQEYSQPPILPSAHFLWVVKYYLYIVEAKTRIPYRFPYAIFELESGTLLCLQGTYFLYVGNIYEVVDHSKTRMHEIYLISGMRLRV